VACCKEPKSADCTQVYSTFVSLSGPPVVGDVFTHASSAGVRVVLTSRQVVPAPRLPKEAVLMSDAL